MLLLRSVQAEIENNRLAFRISEKFIFQAF